MMDLLLQMALSNACFAFALALGAVAAGAKAKRPHLAHLLWLLVFVKLVTPPLVTVPVGIFSPPPQKVDAGARAFGAGAQPTALETVPGSSLLSRFAPLGNRATPGLVALWLLGSAVVLVWSMARVYRFGRLLAAESDVPPPELREEAERMARRLGLATTPTICTTTAHLSPMVWWTGGPVRIVLPRVLLERMDAQDWRWILAHELAHVRRRDYVVRWVEWLACVYFWWNPVVWWAQRNLRATEEICCDDLVLSSLNVKPKSYADSLLSAVEFLARPAVRVPAMASEINSGGHLERRFRMMVSEKPNRSHSRWSRMCVLVCAVIVLPLGLVSAQDYEAVGKRLKESVQKGEITQQQAETMMATLKKEAIKKDQAAAKGLKEKTPAKDQNNADLDAARKKLQAKVQTGELTKEQALAQMAALKEAAAKKDQTPKKDLQKKPVAKSQGPIDLDAAWKKLQAKVQAGELTKEQAEAQMAALKKEPVQKHQNPDRTATFPMKVKKDVAKDKTVQKAVREKKAAPKDQGSDRTMVPPTKMKKDLGSAGNASKKDAPTKDIKKKPAAPADNDAIARELKAAVQAGKLTKEEAKAKWEALRKEAAPDK